ncbi:MAG: hypothetical protein JWO05_3768 [Gemmatimonadetes bacterium]|nr:hypothetical protein [Gemmatimonadota bacterium]
MTDPLRIVLIGSESTGKSTLTSQLASHFGAPWSVEFVRDYAAKKVAPLGIGDHGPIARGQAALEDAAVAQAVKGDAALVFHDTDLLSTVVYCRHYFGRCPEWIESLAAERVADLYLLCDIDIEWIADPARDRGDRRSEMHDLFEAVLVEFDADYEVVKGEDDERLKQAIALVDEFLEEVE